MDLETISEHSTTARWTTGSATWSATH